MTRRTFLNALALAAASQGLARRLYAVPAEPEAPAAAPNQFSFDLYAELARKESANLFFSPYSIHTALAMTAGGARGQTLTQMAGALHLGTPNAETHALRGRLIKWISAAGKGDKPPVELTIANRLWGLKGYPYHQDFLDLLRKHYQADLEPVDFARSEEARRTINAWVEAQTRKKIKDLLPSGSITALTRLVLTNAVYFKGAWAEPFNARLTRREPFKLGGDRTAEVPMMNATKAFRHGETPSAQVLELPYAGDNQLSMLVVLPRKADGLAELEKPQALDGLIAAHRASVQVSVSLPKFRLEQAFSLPQALQSLGMVDAFDDRKADFSGIATIERGLHISDVVHKAYVDVNEEGTEAAAATGVVIAARVASMPKVIPFRADRPFLFAIRHNDSGALLFLGRVADPRL